MRRKALEYSVREFALRSNDPAPGGSNTHERDLKFRGSILIEVEEIWNDGESRGTKYDGEIINPLAIYLVRSRRIGLPNSADYVAKQCRYNPRALLLYPERREPIPFFSQAVGVNSLDDAVSWIESGPLIIEGDLAEMSAAKLTRLQTM